MTFVYGVNFGNDKVHQWVVSIITSFFSSLLIFQPLMVLIMIWVSAKWFKSKPFDDDHSDFDENDVTLYYDSKDPSSQFISLPQTVKVELANAHCQGVLNRMNEIPESCQIIA